MTSIKAFATTIISVLVSISVVAQCEDLKGNTEAKNNWQKNYREFFGVDSTFQFIEADSVLVFYFSNPQNETNYGMPCCYYLAEKYAQKELAQKLNILYQKLDKQDSVNFSKAQQTWQTFYNREWEFLRNAFVAYANYQKYGLGREVMIETQARRYEMIKDRILIIESYIETATSE